MTTLKADNYAHGSAIHKEYMDEYYYYIFKIEALYEAYEIISEIYAE